MCLVTDVMAEPLIALEDIPIFKVLYKDTMLSPNRGFLYHRNILYRVRYQYMQTTPWTAWDEEDIKYLDDNYAMWRMGVEFSLVCINEGFHACLKKERMKRQLELCPGGAIFDAIIPKGSKYFYNITHACVSNQIIIL